MKSIKKRLLNLGCGSRYREDGGWTNVDFNGTPGAVIAHDLGQGIPFPDTTFEVVYHSHVLEHFSRQDGARLMGECFRVLKPDGVCRVAVPNLEDICRQYLAALEGVLRGEVEVQGRYRWMLLELLDQCVRHRSRGEMGPYLEKPDVPERDFIIDRIGKVAKLPLCDTLATKSFGSAGRPTVLRRGWRFANRKLSVLRRAAFSLGLTRHEKRALEVGLFRLQGEVHLWMYDRYSLSELMREAGFVNMQQRMANSSRIGGWEQHYLDIDLDGSTYKPDSLFLEGVRPG